MNKEKPSDGTRKPAQRRYVDTWVPIGSINILRQVRASIRPERVAQLHEGIRQDGLFQRPFVRCFKPKEATEYLRLLKEIWGVEYSLDELHCVESDSNTVYPILVYGFQRLEALQRQAATLNGNLPDHFRRKGGQLELRVTTCDTLEPLNAIGLMVRENTYNAPPAADVAFTVQGYAALRERNDGKAPNVAQLSRELGLTPEAVRGAQRFFLLPATMRDAVRNGELDYPYAVQLARLVEAKLPAETVRAWWQLVTTQQHTLAALRRKVTACISDEEKRKASIAAGGDGALDLATMMSAAQTQVAASIARTTRDVDTRRLAGAHLTTALTGLRAIFGYLSRTQQPLTRSPLLTRSLVTLVGAIANCIANIIPLLQQLDVLGDKLPTLQKATEAQALCDALASRMEEDAPLVLPSGINLEDAQARLSTLLSELGVI